MTGRLDDKTGMIHDRGWNQPMAMDRELRRTVARQSRPVTVDAALRAAEEQRAAADQSPIAQAIPGYNRLP